MKRTINSDFCKGSRHSVDLSFFLGSVCYYILSTLIKNREQQSFKIYQMLANIIIFYQPFTFLNSQIKIKVVLLLFKYIKSKSVPQKININFLFLNIRTFLLPSKGNAF